jgi:hypothetical protein
LQLSKAGRCGVGYEHEPTATVLLATDARAREFCIGTARHLDLLSALRRSQSPISRRA